MQHTYLHREGGEGEGIEPEIRLERQQFTKLGRKYQHTNMTECISSLQNLINTCSKVPFLDDDILLWYLYS